MKTSLAAMAVATALCSSETVAMPDAYLTASTLSYHSDRTYRLNEEETTLNQRNGGVGIQIKVTKNWKAIAGTYNNSYHLQSNYYGVHWKATDLMWGWSLGLAGGYVSGYHFGRVFVTPVFSHDWGRFGLDIPIEALKGQVIASLVLRIRWQKGSQDKWW